MQNWEVLQKKISEMNKDAFITFAKENLLCDILRGMLDINVKCKRCKYKFKSPVDCKRLLLEDEYQPPKQEKWIVHRTLRTQNKEVYLCKKGIKTNYYICRIKDGYSFDGFTTDNNEKAECFSFDKATKIRDVLNDDRVGKQYLWVISKVEE